MELDTEREQSAGRTRGSGTADGPVAAVSVRDLTKVYGSGDDAVRAVDGVSFDVEQGTAVGLLGPNGAGKTTTIKSLLGLIVPTDGGATVSGVDVVADTSAAFRHVGAMLEGARNTYWRLTVRENLRFFAALSGQRPSAVRERHDELLERFDLFEKADTPVRELSRGQQQKVSLASTLARDADVVFLDEPTLGLDVESSVELRRLVEEQDLTVFLSSHDMDVVEHVCDRVIIMNDGEIAAAEAVEDLLDLFQTQAYEVTVEDAIPEDVRGLLRDEYGAGEFERIGTREQFEVSVTGEEFYALVDDLRAAGLVVQEFDAVEPDLEDVFIHLVNDDRGGDR